MKLIKKQMQDPYTNSLLKVTVGRLKIRRFSVLLALVFATTCVIGSSLVFAGRVQNSRPRRSAAMVQQPKPTPTPVPRTSQTVNQQPATPTQSATPPPTQR